MNYPKNFFDELSSAIKAVTEDKSEQSKLVEAISEELKKRLSL